MRKTMFFKIVTLMISIAVVFTACKKDEPANTPKDVEVEFVIQQTDFENLKSTDEDVPKCNDMPWSYVKFTIDGTNYTSNILHVGDDILTQAVKLPAGVTYQLTEFLVYSDVLPVGEGSEDVLVRAAPAVDSKYWDLMENPLNVDVEVFEFSKRQVIVDVLCFEDLYYEAFGFNWFEMNDVKIERQCFFGDICVDDLSVYEGSLYEDQSQGLQMDMPAIMKIEVYKSVDQDPPVWGDPIRTFTNDEWQNPGEGECMEVYWANDLDLTEDFKFELYVWLPDVGGVFGWTLIDTPWEFQDENCPDPGVDGVVDYVLGDCQIDDPDFQFPAVDCPAAFDQGFETDITGWFDGGDYGSITRIASGNASKGSFIALVDESDSGPYTKFDAYSDTWTGTWVAEVDVYIDPSWADGKGFEYSVASNGSDDAHQRDFIFQVAKDASEGKLLVGVANGTGHALPPDNLEDKNHFVVTTEGWYTLQHKFIDNGGILAVEMSLLDDMGNVLWSETLSSPLDLIPGEVGGNRYGWFTIVAVDGGLQIDETQLFRSCN